MPPEGEEGNRIGVHHTDDEGRQAGRCPVPTHHEVPERPKRRRSTAEYKLAILNEADFAIESGEIGALLRRQGLRRALAGQLVVERCNDRGMVAELPPLWRWESFATPHPSVVGEGV
jgi:hypothetical protein